VNIKNTLAMRIRKKFKVRIPTNINTIKGVLEYLDFYIAAKKLKTIRLKHELRKTKYEIIRAKLAKLAIKLGIVK